MSRAQRAFLKWREQPAPKRGETIRVLGNLLREKKAELGALVTLENGKIRAEGEGEVQEMIDICDFAVGLSRQLYGLTIASERPRHRMYEQWHPLGPIGVISAFNFPVAVWSWNSTIAAVCGDTVVWKPSSKVPLASIATTRLAAQVMEGSGFEGVFNLVVGSGSEIGDTLINDRRLPLISARHSWLPRYASRDAETHLAACPSSAPRTYDRLYPGSTGRCLLAWCRCSHPRRSSRSSPG